MCVRLGVAATLHCLDIVSWIITAWRSSRTLCTISLEGMKMRPGAQLKPVTGIGSLIRWSVLALVCLFLPAVAAAGAKLQIDETRWVSLGGGLRASANFIEDAAPSGSDYSKDFRVNNARLYVNGQIFKGILATFNTEFVEGDEAKVVRRRLWRGRAWVRARWMR